MLRHVFILAALCAIGFPASSYAETLDDNYIRAFYDREAALIHDPDQVREFMEARLDDRFVLETDETHISNNGSPQTSREKFDKTQAIDDAVKGYTLMRIDEYQYNIISIKYSEDHQYVYVNNTVRSAGAMKVSDKPIPYLPTKYVEGAACMDVFALVAEKVRMIRSLCNVRVTITQ